MAIDVSVSTNTPEQTLIALLIAASILAAAGIVLYRLRYLGLDDDRKSIVARVETQLARQTPGTVRLEPEDNLERRREDIRGAFATAGAVEDVTSTRAALGAVGDAVIETYRPLAERVPPLARRLFGLALVVLIAGALAVSHETIIRALQSSGSLDALRYWPGAALRDAQYVLGYLAGLPVLGTTGALAFAYTVLLFEWAFRNYWAVAAILVVVGLRLALLQDVDAGSERELPDPRDVGFSLVAVTVGAWTVILVASGIGRAVATEAVGQTIAAGVALFLVAVALLAAGFFAVQFARSAVADLRAADGDEQLLVLARVLAIGFVAIAGPLVPVWVALALLHLPAIGGAWLAANLVTQGITGGLGVALLVGGLLTVRDAAADVRAALSETLSRNSVRAALGARAMPVGIIGFVYFVGIGFGAGVAIALGLGLVAGLIARGLWALAQRVRYRAQVVDSSDPGSRRVIIHAYRLELPDGETEWFARVNGDAVAHPDRASAVDAVVEAARDWFADGQQHPSLAGAHADQLRQDGVTEVEETRTRIRSQVRRRAEGRVRQEGMLEREELEDELADEYPSEVWRPELRALRTRGPLVEREGYVFAD